ncbi:MAG: glutathione S-transferase family protein [Pseudomonadales bacterium]|nr:glutathione S-transferase family protein [Pseudomonadales bacterium]
MTHLTVYHLPGRWGLPSVSPFCLKLDAFLRIVEVPHEAITAATPFGGPKGKAPWITLDGETHGDSSLIIERLKAIYSVDPDRHLSRNARGTAVTIERLIEENLYWAMVFDRWCRPENWGILKSSVLGDIPQPMRALLAPFAKRAVKKQLIGHGMGLHCEAEIRAIAARDIQALSDLLAEQSYFFGDLPSLTDATVYSLLANIYYVEFNSPMKSLIEDTQNLVPFLTRFKSAYYPESVE